ncbi:MAG: class I SAM-dependent methyltransferase [Hyphomicrobiaceae bacterium]
MLIDAGELVEFYQTPIGKMARRLVGARLRASWPHVDGLAVVGHGFAVPYLAHFRNARHVVGVMPASQGAVRWPHDRPSQVLLAENGQIPLPDLSVDRLVAVHSLESAADPRRLLREFWRVLKGEGRMIVIVPNRRGVWARFDATPFGSGQPYSRGQLERLLTDALFHPTGWNGALYAPPINTGLVVQSATTYERVGTRLWPAFSGVVMVEATKELMAPIGGGKTVKATPQLETAGGGEA